VTSYAKKEKLAYIIGVMIGDGNLSNPNSRAIRARITCDTKYSNLIARITKSIQEIFPDNKVSLVSRKDNCVDISCYSNQWGQILEWEAGLGSKYNQNVSVPAWIMKNSELTAPCLRGLFETDGCEYNDRGYKMINFVTIIPALANDTMRMIKSLNFDANVYKHVPKKGELRYTIRITKKSEQFIKLLHIDKS